MNYTESLSYLYSLANRENQPAAYAPENFNLDRVSALLADLGNPHHRFWSVHVAGTKGKGSTCAMMASVLQQAGYRTGLYTSPHLHTFRERIQINGTLITEERFAEVTTRVRPYAERISDITTFEVATALAFLYFAEEGVDGAVLEVGMGGRLDATNIVMPLVAIITSLSLDHMIYLGWTIEAIATEKAGIIKAGVPLVSAPQVPEAMAVIERVSQDKGSPLTRVSRDWAYQLRSWSSHGQRFRATGPDVRYANLRIPFLGEHQLINVTVVLAAIEALRRQGVTISRSALRRGLRLAHWPGRLEVLSGNPALIVDGAHNPDSAHRLVAALRDYLRIDRFVLIFGVSADKDAAGMLAELLPHARAVVLTASHHARAANPQDVLLKLAEPYGIETHVAPDPAAALDTALEIAGQGTPVVATGSLFLVAEVQEAWRARTDAEPYPCDPV